MSLPFFLPFIFSCRYPAASSTSAQWQLQRCEWQTHLLLGDTCQPERPSPQTFQCHWHFCIPKLKEMCMAYESVTVMRLAKYKCHYYNWHALLLDIDGFNGAWLHFRRQKSVFGVAMCKIQARKRNESLTPVSKERNCFSQSRRTAV